MIKTLTKHGNSWALVIDKPILDLLNIRPDTPLEVKTDGDQLIVSAKAKAKASDRAFQRALREVNAEYGDVLRKLAE